MTHNPVPKPPKRIIQSPHPLFEPADALEEWLRRTFLKQESAFYNPEHDHLNSADIGALWTNVTNVRQMRRIAAEARMAKPQAKGPWAKAREEMQMRQWFGLRQLDFLITVDAVLWTEFLSEQCLALSDHELYHCAQAVDRYLIPKFHRDSGLPVFALRGHDVEEFVGVVRRWGVVDNEVEALVAAGNAKPLFGARDISRFCGVAA